MGMYFCIHGHFYQPPREDPFTGEVPREVGAEPYSNFNEKITAECYTPNAQVGNFARISFNLGGTLAAWMARHAPDTYNKIVAADRANLVTYGVGNAVAQSVHHTILPLANARDKLTQVLWGIASFRYRFGRDPVGMWLPEMAVDRATLQVLAEAGIKYTILSAEQVHGPLGGAKGLGAGPYWVRLEDRRSIAVFVRDTYLSNTLSFDMDRYRSPAEWTQAHLLTFPSHAGAGLKPGGGRREGAGGLILVATDGETFGHHHRSGVEFLRLLLSRDLSRAGYEITYLNRYLKEHPPRAEVEVLDGTSWSCAHGVARWATGCPCTAGDSTWKRALRTALTTLSDQLDGVYEETLSVLVRDPWRVRDRYIQVVLGIVRGPDFIAAHAIDGLTSAQVGRALLLLQAQLHRQRMYTSCAYFFEELSRPEPRYAIANAARAILLTRRAVGVDLLPGFRRDLAAAVSTTTGKTGADLLDEILTDALALGEDVHAR